MLNHQITTFLLSMLPFTELRGAIPLSMIKFNMPPFEAFFWSVLGNIAIAGLLLLGLNKIQQILSQKSNFCKKWLDKIFKHSYLRHKKKFELLQDLALITIVAVPLPFTGAWTGSIAAYVFNIPIKKSFPLISMGVIIAGIIVVSLTTAGLAWWA